MTTNQNQISFIVDNITDYEAIASEASKTQSVHVLNSKGDILSQIASILEDYSNLDAIHLFSHGTSGSLDLGNITLDNQTLQNYHEILAQIGSSLSQNGDILLYGCNVAEGQAGVEFISKLSQATGADIAASDDVSGASDKGGDWVLEVVNGSVESSALTSNAYTYLLAGPSANFTMETAFTSGYVIDVNDLTIDINGAGPERIKISTPTGLQWSNPAEEGFNSYGYNNFQADPRTATITYDVDSDGFDDPFNLNSLVFLDPDGETQTWKIKPNGSDTGAENFTLTGDGNNLAFATFTPTNTANFTNLTSVVLEHLTGSASIGVDDFDIVAYAGSATAPEITVNLFMSEIADGGVSTFDDTDVGDTPGMIRYSIINDGDADLNISAITITGDSEFTLGTLTVNDVETTVIPVGEEARIEVYFTPTANGIRTAEISIASDDSDENPFNISIDGLGVLNVADNTAPENTISATYTTTEDTKLSITDLAVADAEMDTLTVTLSVNNGTINLPNINTATNITAIDADGLDGSITFSGMADDINLMLDEGVDFYAAANANGNGYATLTMTTSDGTADDVVNTATINVTAVNDAPTFDIHSGAFSSSFVGEDTDGTYYSDEYASCNASALLPDGSIINVGDTTIDGTTYVSLLKLGNDGLPDSTFGEDESGHMVLDTSIFNDGGSATSVAVRPDGQIVISGYLDSGSPFFAILESDGSLDESYDITYSNNLPENEALDTNILYLDKVALQADGKIVLVGGQNPNGGNGGDVVLMRYNADGTVDTDFGTGGAIVTDLGNADSSSDVVIDTSGNIFVAVGGGDNSDMGIVKYTSSGVLDTDFGTDGIAWTGIENNAEAGAIKIDANGKIVLAGSFDGTYDNSDIALARFNANGILDESFGTNGTTIFNTDDIMDGYGGDDFANSLEIDASGAIYVGGEFGFYGENDEGYEGSASFKSVAKFGSDGTLDTGFAQGGMIIPEYVDDGYIIVDTQAQEAYDDDYWDSDNDPHGESGSINSILIQADGKIVMGGSYSYIDNYDYVYDYSGMSVSRIDANGNFDTYNFGYENDTVYNSDTDDFAEGGDAVTIGGSNWSWLTPSVYDVEQHAANNYSSGTLTIHRAGGANGEDLIRFDTSVNSAMTLVGITLEGTSATTGNIKHGGSTFATFNTNATDNEASTDGQLVINFTSSETAATQMLVNALTASISYDNTNDVNPAYDEGEVELSWLYNDGDEQETTSSCYISIEGDDDGGIEGTVAVIGTPTTGTTLSITGLDTITDPDLVTDENEDGTVPEDDLSFQWQVSSDSGETWENIDGAYDSTFEVTEIESGKEIRVVVGYEDPTNGSYTEIQSDTAGEGGEDNGGGGNSGGGDNGGGSTPTVPTTPTTPPATTTTVDGTTVQTTTTTQTRTTTDTNGHTTATTVSTEQIVIAPVTSNRTEQTGSTTTADVPLFWGESTRTEWATTASIPTGVGLTSEGSRAPAQTQTAQTVLDDLIYYIDTTTPSTDIGKTNMLNGGETFLQALSNIETLIVNKITLSTTNTEASQVPITITGVANTVVTTDGSIAPVEALVIDAQSLQAGSMLNLQNVEFAVIIGENLTIRGGEGQNILFSGAGSQNIMLGEDDDQLYAGDGDDTVGSAGGDDSIFGEGGDDTVFGGEGNDMLHGGGNTDVATYSGNMADYVITRDEGKTYVALASNPNEVDTLINVENIEFADSSYTIENSITLSKIATLYMQILDRQAEIDGFQYWAKDTTGLGNIALGFITSVEYKTNSGVNWETLDVSGKVEQFYEALLGRSSDEVGKVYWVDAINAGMTFEQAVEGFIDSVELSGIYQSKEDWNFSL